MAYCSSLTICGCLVVLICLICAKASTTPTFKDQLAQLTDKSNEIKKVFATKETTNLGETQLQRKIEQEFNSIAQHQGKQQIIKNVQFVRHMKYQTSAKIGVFRTCQEMYNQNPTLVSGWYWIDPDSEALGDSAIYVYCAMTSGRATTAVPHDSEAKIEVDYCLTPGCYSRKVNYNASMSQLKTLAGLSAECHQYHKYDCIDAPFEFNGQQYSWWNDRNNVPQYFWSGIATPVHTCECGIDGRCINTAKKCNCDSGLTFELADSGVIEATELLPVTRLSFGRNLGSGHHTLGKFECSG